MTAKRFEVFKTDIVIGINDNGETIGNVYAVCDLLNKLDDTCKFLKIENESLENGATKYAVSQIIKENEQLRELLENGLDVSQVEIDEELERMNKMNNRS